MKLIFFAAALTTLACLAHGQNLICNGGFESPQFGGTYTVTDLPCWQTSGGQQIEVQSKGANAASGVLGNQYVELDVTTNSDIYQDIPTVIGQRYLIRFWVANRVGSPSSAFKVLWDGTLLGTVTRLATNTTFSRVFAEVVATKTVSRVAFAANGPSDSVGDLLDEVSVNPIPAVGSRLGWTYYIPHFTDGTGWESSLSLANTSPPGYFAANVEYTVYGDDGKVLDTKLNGTISLDPAASTTIPSPQAGTNRVGWVKVVSSEPLRASVVFRFITPGKTDLEATVLSRELTSQTVAPFDNSGVFITGFAALNPNAFPITLTFSFRDTAGVAIVTGRKTLLASAHASFPMNTEFPATSGKKGSVEIVATDAAGDPVNFAPLGLRFNFSNSGLAFTTLPY